VPKSIDAGPASRVSIALLVDLALVAIFALQHSIMARPAFKRWWTRIVPQPIERSTYVLIANLVTLVLMWQWRSIDQIVWDVQQPAARGLLWGLFAAGWLLVFAASLMINHFDLFGTRQVWLYLRGRPYTPLTFRTPFLYNRMRHPLYVGWTIAFWATPTMTLGHMLFAGTMTVYMAIAALIEERDLVRHFGDIYRAYQRRVPMYVPRIGGVGEPVADIPATTAAVPQAIAS
jgi:protein-S-isoprenylcysteine O-methyltransferase Ste14